ncbi:MAG: PIN domain-containing protein [Candidatus Latescibacteria bacterium]|nr:PIN domain-containing protein [Candidatus Latescibacterota bacterium]
MAAKVFVDTAAWIALVNTSDQFHAPARQVMGQLRSQNTSLVTTEFNCLEVADALSAPAFRPRTISFLDGLRQIPILQIIPASTELLSEGWALYRQRADKEWGLTDCISFAVMKRARITQAITTDHHFEQAGYTKLL